MPVVFSWNFATKIAEVQAPDTVLTIQDLLNQARDVEDSLTPVNGFLPMTYPSILDATGKGFLGPTKKVGITLEMKDEQQNESGWKVKFAARGTPTQCEISGGNLARVVSTGKLPVDFSTNVMVTVEGDTSAALVTDGLTESTLKAMLIDGLSFEQIMKLLLSMGFGDFDETSVSGTVKDFAFKDRVGAVLETLRITKDTGRVRQ